MHQSVLTGNIRPLAEVKLGAFGLLGSWSWTSGRTARATRPVPSWCTWPGSAPARRPAPAAEDGTERGFMGGSGSGFAGELTVLIGDTPLDVAAALATGARAVGVATGGYTEADLASAGAHVVLPDLSDTPRVLAAILAAPGTAAAARRAAAAGRAAVRRARHGDAIGRGRPGRLARERRPPPPDRGPRPPT